MNYDLQTIWIKAAVSLIDVNSKTQTHGVSATPPFPVSQASEGLRPNVHCLIYTKMLLFCVLLLCFLGHRHTSCTIGRSDAQRSEEHEITQTHVHKRTHTHTHIHTYIHTYIHTNTHAHKHTCTQTHKHTCIHPHACTHTHTPTHTQSTTVFGNAISPLGETCKVERCQFIGSVTKLITRDAASK